MQSEGKTTSPYKKYLSMNKLIKRFNFQVFISSFRFLSLKVYWQRSIWEGVYGKKKIN